MKRLIRLELYTDGSCLNNFYGGWAYYLVEDSKVIAYDSGMTTHTSHQRMELYSTIEGFKKAENFFDCHKDTILVISDSAYLINGITSWINGWRINNWMNSRKEPVKNQELWKILDELLDDFKKKYNVSFKKVRGHSGIYWNEVCDKLANEAMDGI